MEDKSINKKWRDTPMEDRFRGFMPVVVDVETAGFNADTDALLEITAVMLKIDQRQRWTIDEIMAKHIKPFAGANLEPTSLTFTGIDVNHPFRQQIALPEKEAIQAIFKAVKKRLVEQNCKRAILVGHNSSFDLSFLNAAVKRIGIKKNPFHLFSSFDTATLAGVAYGQTVLSRAVTAAGMEWDETQAHTARYDAEKTAQLFCRIVNLWSELK